MTYQALARKWRPRTFEEVVGQGHVVTALANALDSGRVHHAYLFAGTRGVGKTTLARIFAKALNCEQGVSSQPCGSCGRCQAIEEGRFVDLIEVDAASRTKVDDTRELLDNVQYAPTVGRYKVYLIDEVHMLSGHSFNALLKTLEEPPEHVKFLLATTDPQKLPVTVLSRCLQINLKALHAAQIVERLEEILAAEDIAFERPALDILARAAAGSLRDALSLLDQAIAHGDGAIGEEGVRAMLGMLDDVFVRRLIESVSAQDAAACLQTVAEMAERAVDYGAALDDLLVALHNLALVQLAPDALVAKEIDPEPLAPLAEAISAEELQLYYQIGLIGKRDLALAPDPRTGFEMVMLRMIAFQPAAGAASPPDPTAASAGTAPARGSRPLAAASSPPSADAPSPPRSLADVVADTESWTRFVEQSGLAGVTRQLAMNMAPRAEADGGFLLVLDERHEHLRSREREAAIASLLAQHLGGDVRVRVAVSADPPETPSQLKTRQTAEARDNALETLQRDATVRDILERFDATMVSDSLRTGESEP